MRKNDCILELGCGDGIPVGQSLSTDYIYTGIDISPAQIKNACRNVPAASFITGDMTAVDYPASGFHAVIVLYSIVHVPMDEQKELLTKVFMYCRSKPVDRDRDPLDCSRCYDVLESWRCGKLFGVVYIYWIHNTQKRVRSGKAKWAHVVPG